MTKLVPIGIGGSMSQIVGLPNNSYQPITNTEWVRARLCKLQKRCTRLAAASDKGYQLLAHGRQFSVGTPASYTTQIGRHDLADILLKNGVKHQKSLKFNLLKQRFFCSFQTIISCFRHYRMKTIYLDIKQIFTRQ